MRDAEKDFLQFIISRCDDICNDISQNEWYLKTQEQIITVRARILITPDKKVLDDYDLLSLEVCCRTAKEVYLQAYKDGAASRGIDTNFDTKRART